MFNEITKKAILEAIKHPGEIDMRMVDAQQARRVLDRLVGYKISPILWDKVRRGLSAGRVQSVALKLICDREREIEAFVPEEYWHITARLRRGPCRPSSTPGWCGRATRRPRSRNEAEAKAVLADLERATFVVSSVATKERKKHPVPPFITSKLQQASRFPVKKTMMVAQQLYEGIELPGRRGADRSHHLHAHRLGARGRPGARRSARAHPRRSTATPTCPSSRTATRSRRPRRTRTKRSGRRRWRTTRSRCARI